LFEKLFFVPWTFFDLGAFRSEASQGRPTVGADAPHPRSAARRAEQA
jgi:hypothetical protein